MTETKNKLVLLLDGGHGWNTSGKRSPLPGEIDPTALFENEVNDAMVNKVSFGCFNHNVQTYIVAPEASDVSLKIRTDRINKKVNEFKSQGLTPVVISFHADAFSNPSVRGSRIYFQQILPQQYPAEVKRRKSSQKIAQILSMTLDDCVGIGAVKVIPGNYHIIREIDCPGILIELAFMTNTEDLKLLKSDQTRNQWCENIVLFIVHQLSDFDFENIS